MSKYLRFNLAFLRSARGKLTQLDVAKATGLSQKALSALETGASKGVEFSTIARLCDFLKCTPNDLLVLEEEELDEVSPSKESLDRADVLISRGLGKAMQMPERTPAEIWADFDALREKMQSQAQVQKAQAKIKEQEEKTEKCSRS